MKYYNDESIWRLNSVPNFGPADQVWGNQVYFKGTEESTEHFNFTNNNEIVLGFNVMNTVQYNTRYPDTILSGFAKLGGLLAILRIGMFFHWYHRKTFEHDVSVGLLTP
jgi:hypothetical protein